MSIVKDIPFFSSLTDSEIELIDQILIKRTFKK